MKYRILLLFIIRITSICTFLLCCLISNKKKRRSRKIIHYPNTSYKPLIIISGLSGCIVWSLLIWTRSLLGLQVLEIFYGTYMATEVAYYTYIYAKVDKVHYMKVTSHTRAAIMIGRFVAGSVGQTLVYTGAMDYLGLNYITFGGRFSCIYTNNITFFLIHSPGLFNDLGIHITSCSDKHLLSPEIETNRKIPSK